MRARLIQAALVFIVSAQTGLAQTGSMPDRLLTALGLPQIVEIMRTEGLRSGDELARDMIMGSALDQLQRDVDRIYNPDAMEQTVRAGFAEAVGDTDLAPLVSFFESDEGQRVVGLELSARQAMTDPGVEEAARERARSLDGSDDPRFALVTRFIAANDLVVANVAGALNSNFAFYKGLGDGGAFEMSEGDMLADVWSQEDETRADTREWLYAFLLMAYGPLGDGDLERYIALSSTPEGQAMNRALFTGFNSMFDQISYALGRSAARAMQSEEL